MCLFIYFFFEEKIFFQKKNISKKILSPDKVIATKKLGNWQINKSLKLDIHFKKFYKFFGRFKC